MKKTRPEVSAAELLVRLRERYAGSEWAFFEELRGGTAFTRESRADGLAMNLWPSRGMEIHGFELKVSRSDWKRELDNPGKSEPIQQFCDRWWVVTGYDELVQPGELPPTWGWMVPFGDKLKVRVEAPKLPANPPDRAFIAAILRRASSEDAIARQTKVAVDAAWKRWQKDQQRHDEVAREMAGKELASLRAAVAEFERASGVKIDRWSNGDIGEAVKFVLGARGKGNFISSQIEHLARQARRIAEEAEQAVAQWPKEMPPPPAAPAEESP